MGIAYSVNAADPSSPTQLDGSRLEAPVPPPRRWTPDRPAEVGSNPRGAMFGTPAPDAGFALLLIREVIGEIESLPGEDRDDIELALAATAIRRASLHGRAPVREDVEWAIVYWGMARPTPAHPPSGLTPRERAELFAGSGHSGGRQVARVPTDEELSLSPDELVEEERTDSTSGSAVTVVGA